MHRRNRSAMQLLIAIVQAEGANRGVASTPSHILPMTRDTRGLTKSPLYVRIPPR
jgi:hypothetical protein